MRASESVRGNMMSGQDIAADASIGLDPKSFATSHAFFKYARI